MVGGRQGGDDGDECGMAAFYEVTCREFIAVHLEDWLQGTLPPRRVRQCTRHVLDCPHCDAYVHSFLEVAEALRDLRTTAGDQPAVPESLVRRILAAAS